MDANTFERGRFVLEDVAQELGAALEIVQQAPGFLRTLLSTEVKLGDTLSVDAGIRAGELREWHDSLIVRLRAAALPKPPA